MSTEQSQQQVQTFNDFISLIQDKQIEHALKLSKQTSVSVNGKIYKKKPLSAKQWRELSILSNEMAKLEKDSIEQLDKLIELRTKGAQYYFGIPPAVFDENYEKLSSIIEGNILRSNSGLSPDIDLDELLHEYQQSQIKK